ncbi:hypothetical protein BH10PSE16_BH10PSE16_02620 [soil metagenome]
MEDICQRAINPGCVSPAGPLTSPRSWGVYQLPGTSGSTRQFRFGNHPVRMQELEREFGACQLVYLFLARPDAVSVAAALNDFRERSSP